MKNINKIKFYKMNYLPKVEALILIHEFIAYSLNKDGLKVTLEKLSKIYFKFRLVNQRYNIKKIKKRLFFIMNVLYKMDYENYLVSSCLSIAILIQTILFILGYDANLCIGYYIESEKMYNHAWVELKELGRIDRKYNIDKYKKIAEFNMSNIIYNQYEVYK